MATEKRHEDFLLGIASLYHIGTEDAYNDAVKIISDFKESYQHTFPRIELILAWFAIDLGKLDSAITQYVILFIFNCVFY
jgi:hypothetical protein